MNKFIVFEGPDGCGKSTILDLVYNYYKNKNIPVIRTREPGGTDLGEEIRDIVLNSKSNISSMSEAFLMASSRCQLVDELIIPSLKTHNVLSDRFVLSSLVYQGIARGIGFEKVKELNDFALKELKPDLTLYFSLDYDQALARKTKRGTTDNIEGEKGGFHRSIHEGYEMVYNRYKEDFNIIKIDASKSISQVFESVAKILD